MLQVYVRGREVTFYIWTISYIIKNIIYRMSQFESSPLLPNAKLI